MSPVESSLPCLRQSQQSQARLPLRTSIPSLSTSSSCSKESSSASGSRSSLTESRIPISKSQDDLLRNVALRTGAERLQRDKRPVSSGKLLRPTSYRNQSPRQSKLMSRNSVEVLAYTENQKNEKNSALSETGRKYYSQYSKVNKKYETASKFTKKFGSKESSLNLYQKNTKKIVNSSNGDNKTAGLNNRNSSFIPQPSAVQTRNNLKTSEKKPTPPVKTSVKSSPGRPAPSKKNGVVAGNSSQTRSSANLTPLNKDSRVNSRAKRLSGEPLKIDDRPKSAKTESANSPGVPGSSESPVISPGPGGRMSPGLVSTPETVERLISEQLARGKLPPKAKFRADDEISIGDPETEDRNSHDDKVSRKGPVTPSMKSDKVIKTRSVLGPDSYPPSHASLLVARCLEEGGVSSGRGRGHKTNSLPLNSVLASCDLSSGEKSTSLDKYYNKEKPAVGKSASEGFFQRLSNLRRSFNAHDQKRSGSNHRERGKIRPHLTDSNTPFFQGISYSVRRPNSINNTNNNGRHHKVSHSSYLVLPPVIPSYKPPARKYQFQRAFPVRPRAAGEGRLGRSFSFSDCQVGHQ